MDYWERYHLPMLHTETNTVDVWGPNWGRQQLLELAQLARAGVPVLGFNWYSLMHQHGWENMLKMPPEQARINPIGLVDPRNERYTCFTLEVLPPLTDVLKYGTRPEEI